MVRRTRTFTLSQLRLEAVNPNDSGTRSRDGISGQKDRKSSIEILDKVILMEIRSTQLESPKKTSIA
uniref:Uncharacterized protein n=1 Tax=Hyaloperonospora arabidopsidis (strain Emoy2) TaxID=559515 RepID=M4BPT5_HYAAE